MRVTFNWFSITLMRSNSLCSVAATIAAWAASISNERSRARDDIAGKQSDACGDNAAALGR